nr:hypothetical protein [Tanacetum cinerariifolium]
MDEEYARKLHEELNKDIDWDVAIEHVKKKAKEDPFVQRYQVMKKRPQIESQARKNMIMYLKNVAGFRLDYFKGMSYDDIRPIFEAKFNSNIAFLLKTKEQLEEEENKAIQSINETPAQKAAKRKKLNEEVEDLKKHLEIVPDEDDDLYVSFLTLLKNFDREELESLWSLVKERFSTSKPNNFSDDFLLATLGAMFERPDEQAQVWKNQRTVHGQAKVKSWKLLESYALELMLPWILKKNTKCLMLLVKNLVLASKVAAVGLVLLKEELMLLSQIKADVPLLGELGAVADEPMVGPIVDEIAEPVDEAKEQVIAPVVGMDEDISMLFGDDDFEDDDFSDDDSEGVEGPSTAAVEGPSFPLPAPGLPIPPSVIEDLSTHLGNLEYEQGQLVRKVIHVSDIEVAAGVSIEEIDPRVFAIEGQVQVMVSRWFMLQTDRSSCAAQRHTDSAAACYSFIVEQLREHTYAVYFEIGEATCSVGKKITRTSNEQLHVFDSEDTLKDAEQSRLKMNEFQKDEKVQALKIKPIDYGKLNKLYDNFVPQKELYAEQTYYSSSFTSSEEISSGTKPSMESMPSANPMLADLNEMKNVF